MADEQVEDMTCKWYAKFFTNKDAHCIHIDSPKNLTKCIGKKNCLLYKNKEGIRATKRYVVKLEVMSAVDGVTRVCEHTVNSYRLQEARELFIEGVESCGDIVRVLSVEESS